MNKKGSLYLGFVFAFFFFMFGMLMLPFIKGAVTDARVDLNCSGSISSGNMLLCLGADALVPYFIIGILTLSGGFIGNEL